MKYKILTQLSESYHNDINTTLHTPVINEHILRNIPFYKFHCNRDETGSDGIKYYTDDELSRFDMNHNLGDENDITNGFFFFFYIGNVANKKVLNYEKIIETYVDYSISDEIIFKNLLNCYNNIIKIHLYLYKYLFSFHNDMTIPNILLFYNQLYLKHVQKNKYNLNFECYLIDFGNSFN